MLKGQTRMKHGQLALPERDFTLKRARVPACFLTAAPPGSEQDRDGSLLLDITVTSGKITKIRPSGIVGDDGPPPVDLGGRQVWATLIDMHAHLDKGQVIPRLIPDGTLEGGITNTMEDRRHWTRSDVAARMRFGLRCAYAHGVAAIRTHLDSPEAIAERNWAVFQDLREEWAGRVALEAVGMVPITAFRPGQWGEKLADLIAKTGGVLGCVTDGLGSYEDVGGAELPSLLANFLRLAAERGLDVDLHVDQSDDRQAFALPHIAKAVLQTKFAGRVVCSHCVNLALQSDEVAKQTIELAAEAGLAFVTLPTSMMYLQDRRTGRTPRWRGVTLARELADNGLRIAVAGDNCRDAWFPFGDHDMLDTVQQTVRVFQFDDPVARALAMAGPIPSDITRAGSIGRIVEGGPADLILLSARTLNEAMSRPQSDRIVVRYGRRLTEMVPDYDELDEILG